MDELGIERLEIDPHIEEKLWDKHRVRFYEAAQALGDEDCRIERTAVGFYDVYGRTDAGRPLLVVLVPKGGGHWKVVTAREQNRREQMRR